MGTVKVPRHIRALDKYGMVHGHIWAPEGCPSKFWHHKGARAHMGTGRVLGHIWAPEGCLGTYGHWKGSRENMSTRMVPG